MSVYPPPDFDPLWWAEKTSHVSADYCPQCRPDVDPRDSRFVPLPCLTHKENHGSADHRAVEKRAEVFVHVADTDYL